MVADLKRQYPKRHKHLWVHRHSDHHDLPAEQQRALDATIDWLAERMPEPDLYYAAAQWITSWKSNREDAVSELGESIVEAMYMAWQQVSEKLEDESPDEEDIADDPAAPVAPTPLAVIPPRKSSGRVRAHPHSHLQSASSAKGQYEQAREVWRTGLGRRRADEPNILDWAYGEGGEEGHAAVIEETGRTGVPLGRPPVGTRDPAKAESVILEHCSGYTIEQLRACLAPGKPSAAAKETRDQFDIAIFRISEQRSATSEALAAVWVAA